MEPALSASPLVPMSKFVCVGGADRMCCFPARKAGDLPSGTHQLFSAATLQAMAVYSLGSERAVAKGD